LLSNASKFAQEGKIEVIIKGLPHQIEVSIQDHGIGIEKQDLNRIFDPFILGKTPNSNT